MNLPDFPKKVRTVMNFRLYDYGKTPGEVLPGETNEDLFLIEVAAQLMIKYFIRGSTLTNEFGEQNRTGVAGESST